MLINGCVKKTNEDNG